MKKMSQLCLIFGIVSSLLLGCSGGASQSQVPASSETAGSSSDEDAASEATGTDESNEEASSHAAESLALSEASDEDDENYDTGDASLDNPLNQDEIGDKEILVVSFGTSFNDSRRLTIGAIETAIAEAFPDWSVRRAFTSQIIIDHIKRRDGVAIDNVEEALERAVNNGVKTLVVQPTHLMDGFEYNDLAKELEDYSSSFESVAIGKPLLTGDEDFDIVIDDITAAEDTYGEDTALCFMGHGTEAESNAIYTKLQDILTKGGHDRCYIGTVEAEPSLEDILDAVQEGNYSKVVLRPLMVVAGDHANNDMAGDEDGSWKSEFEKAGYEVECQLQGLGEDEDVQKLYVEHAKAAVDSIKSISSNVGGADDGSNGAGGDSVSSSKSSATQDESSDNATGSADLLYPSDIQNGTYDIEVESSSSMFNIVSCELTVGDESMTAAMTMSGKGYLYLYMGSSSDAENAPDSEYINFTENSDGSHVFSVPVEALNKEISCSSFSKNKSQWYDRTLIFKSDSLPDGAILKKTANLKTNSAANSKAASNLKKTTSGGAAADTGDNLTLEDGKYLVDVALEGGSGKASIDSPAALSVKNGKISVHLIWSSPNYDYMKLADGNLYKPVNSSGNSEFDIPLPDLTQKLSVIADTTAMSQSHEIEYTLQFDLSTLNRADADISSSGGSSEKKTAQNT